MKTITPSLKRFVSLVFSVVLCSMSVGSNFAFAQSSNLTISLVADEDIQIGEAVVLNAAGKIQRGDAANASKLRFVGFAKENAAIGDNVLIDVAGLSNTHTNLDVGKTYYLGGSTTYIDSVLFGQELITGENGFSPAPASNNYERWGQSFTAEVSFTFGAVELYLGKYGNQEDIQVSLYETFGGLPTGTSIWESGVISYQHESPTWLKISTDNAVELEAGSQYVLIVFGGQKAGYWGEATSSPYSGGNQIVWLNGLWQDYSHSGKDFAFKIYKREASTTPQKITSILQSQETVTGSNGFSRAPASNNYERWAQTFYTESAASLSAVELFLGKYGAEEDVKVSVYETVNGLPSGAALWESDVFVYQHTAPEWLKIDLPSVVELHASTTYALVVLGANKGGYWGESTNSTYANGNQVMWVNGQWQDYSSSGKDFTFKLYREETDAAQTTNISIAPGQNVVQVGLAVSPTEILITR